MNDVHKYEQYVLATKNCFHQAGDYNYDRNNEYEWCTQIRTILLGELLLVPKKNGPNETRTHDL